MKFAVLALLGLTAWGNAAQAEFINALVLLPPGCEKLGVCTLGRSFAYVDPKKIGWEAQKGLVTDGASIPPWAQRFVGAPFEEAYIRAAIIHDHYCDRHVRPWRQTHRVFFDALVESGVSRKNANIMYFAVLVGGPKWTKIIAGKPCPHGISCINKVPDLAQVPGVTVTVSHAGETLLAREDLFGSTKFSRVMSDHLPEMEAMSEELSPEQVEQKAADAMRGDFYFKNGDEVGGALKLQVK